MSTILGEMHDLGWKARYNVRGDYPQVKFPDSEWLAIGNRDPQSSYAFLRFTDSRSFPSIQSEGGLWKALYAATRGEARVHYDDFLAWLETLPDWDKVRRLGKLLGILFGCSDRNAKGAGYYLCIAPIIRAFCPGARVLKIPLLVSWTAWHSFDILIRDLPPSCVSSSYQVGARESNEYEYWAVLGSAVLECPVRDMTESKSAKLSRFLFRIEDNVKLPYRQRQTYPRRVAFVLTGSESKVPRGIVGKEGYVPIMATADDYHAVGEYLEEHREQLWAEALSVYHNGDYMHLCEGYFES
ncbi:MAG: hypothetical protein OXN88_03950 [Chloroflexota bacterium]|nr:hypothetical protein [Chloroflexota bacterium]